MKLISENFQFSFRIFYHLSKILRHWFFSSGVNLDFAHKFESECIVHKIEKRYRKSIRKETEGKF